MMKKLRMAVVAVGIMLAGCSSAQTYGNLQIYGHHGAVSVTTVQPRYYDFPRYWSEGYARSSNHWVPYYAPSYTVVPSARSPHYYPALRQANSPRPYVIERQIIYGNIYSR